MIILEHCSQDPRDVQSSAKSLVARSLVQVRGDGYFVHDLLLDFAKNAIDPETKKVATSRQAQYLGRLDVLEGFYDGSTGLGRGYVSLMA